MELPLHSLHCEFEGGEDARDLGAAENGRAYVGDGERVVGGGGCVWVVAEEDEDAVGGWGWGGGLGGMVGFEGGVGEVHGDGCVSEGIGDADGVLRRKDGVRSQVAR